MDTKTATKKKLSLLSFLWKGLGGGLLLFALAGCPGESPIDNPDNPGGTTGEKVEYVMQDVALSGFVKDAGGNPLGGVKVTTGALSATTGSDGTFTFDKAGTWGNTVLVKFEKGGYFTLTRSGSMQDEMVIEAMLYPKGNSSISLQSDFDASSAKTLTLGGLKIELPTSCFVKADGSAYSGTVRADVLNLGSGKENSTLMIPGGDLTTDKIEMVLPIGMMDAIFTDNAGNPLKIKENTNISISFPAPEGFTAATVPLWTFDEVRGVWKEEGSVTKQGSVFTGTTTHFSPKGAGKSYQKTTVMVHATECDNKPAAGARVTIYNQKDIGQLMDYVLDNIFPTYTTNSDGNCTVKVPANASLAITATYQGNTKSQNFSADGLGKQVVYFLFNNGCDKLTFNLKAGPNSSSFIIGCVPKMPLIVGFRFNPLTMLAIPPNPNLGTSTLIVTTTASSGSGVFPNLGDFYWNDDFTEMTYTMELGGVPEWWEGTVKLGSIDSFWTTGDGATLLKSMGINSIIIGTNAPVPLRIENK